jgi:beta-aspartyl-peptidase (threonine type)
VSIYAIAIHGRAVTMKPGELSPEAAALQRVGLGEALDSGWQLLHEGGRARRPVKIRIKAEAKTRIYSRPRRRGWP